MKNILPLLLMCSVCCGASLNIRISIPGVVTNAPGTIDGIGTKVSEYPTIVTMQSNFLFLVAAPSVPTNYNITYGQLVNNINGSDVWTNAAGIVRLIGATEESTNVIKFTQTNRSVAPGVSIKDFASVLSGNGLPWFDGGSIGLQIASDRSPTSTNQPGESAAVLGAGGHGTINYGVVGHATPAAGKTTLSTTNIGVFGLATFYNFPSDATELDAGGFFVTAPDDSLLPLVGEQAVIVGDNFDSGFPLLTLRTNNGTVVTKIAATGVITANGFVGNGQGLTNLHYAYVTNSVLSTGSLVFGGNAYQTNLQADITLGNFASVSPFLYETTILYATNSTGADHTITGPNGSVGPNGVAPAALVCTNKHMTRILVEHYGRDWTNMSKLDL